ncbi:MAG: rod shape-determining protein MreC [Gammaproteobacteria bacterium]
MFNNTPLVHAKLAAGVLLALALMTLDHRSAYLESVRAALSVVVYPIQYLVSLPMKASAWAQESLLTRRALWHENTRLREQNFLLRTQSQKFAALRAENIRLRELLESSLEKGERVLLADLLAVELEPSAHQVVLNKGSKQGVYMGQPVVDAHGILGQVIHVGPFSSTGLLITDVSHALPVQVNRNGVRAIAAGTGITDQLLLSYVPVKADIRKGDLLVSSSLGGRFPEGYPVGDVTKVVTNPSDSFAKVVVTPSARVAQAREVLLVWPKGLPSDLAQHTRFSNVAAR